MVRVSLKSAAAAVTALTMGSAANAAFLTWTGTAGNGLWADAANWSPNVVPTGIDFLTIADATIDLGGLNRAAGSVSIAKSLTLTGGTLAVSSVGPVSNVPSGQAVTLRATLQSNPGSTLGISGWGLSSYLDFYGDVIGTGTARLQVVRLHTPLTISTPVSFIRSSLLDEGAITSTAINTDGSFRIDNSGVAKSARLNPAATISSSNTYLNDVFEVIGNSTTPVSESLASLSTAAPNTVIALDGRGAPLHLHVGALPTSFTLFTSQPLTTRLTTNSPLAQVGGTGGTQTPIVPGLYAIMGPGRRSATSTQGFLTYDNTLADGNGTVVGYRAVRDEEFANSIAGSVPTTNVRLSGAVSVTASQTINALALDPGSDLDLANSDLTLAAGGLLRRGTLGDTATATIRASGTGRLMSGSTLHVITAGINTDINRIVMNAPVVAPALQVSGGGTLILGAPNSLPGGIRVSDSALVVGQAAALGEGPLRLDEGAVRFVGDQTISNPVIYESGIATSSQFAFSSALLTLEAGKTVTITGRISGVGGISTNASGLLRLVGGGDFVGSIGYNPFPTNLSRIELGGTWSVPAGLNKQFIDAGGELFGTGKADLAFDNGIISPGSPDAVGTFTIGRLGNGRFFSINTKIVLKVDLSAATADQLILTDTSIVSAQTTYELALNVLSAPTPQSVFTILRNDALGAAINPFAGIAQNSIVNSGPYQFRVNYFGGDGNDITLTVIPEPASAALIGGLIVLRRRRA